MEYWKKDVLIPDEAISTVLRMHLSDNYVAGTVWKVHQYQPEIYQVLIKLRTIYTWIHQGDHYVALVIELTIDNEIQLTVYDSLSSTNKNTYITTIGKIAYILSKEASVRYYFMNTTPQRESECGVCTVNTLLECANINLYYSRKSLWNHNNSD